MCACSQLAFLSGHICAREVPIHNLEDLAKTVPVMCSIHYIGSWVQFDLALWFQQPAPIFSRWSHLRKTGLHSGDLNKPVIASPSFQVSRGIWHCGTMPFSIGLAEAHFWSNCIPHLLLYQLMGLRWERCHDEERLNWGNGACDCSLGFLEPSVEAKYGSPVEMNASPGLNKASNFTIVLEKSIIIYVNSRMLGWSSADNESHFEDTICTWAKRKALGRFQVAVEDHEIPAVCKTS